MRVLLMAILCALAPHAWALDPTPPTFGRDVAPLLREKCGDCHAPGGLAPFALNTYPEARERAGKIARITLDGLMPPWLPAHGGFSDARRMSDAELALLRRWAESGAPEGEAPSAWPSPAGTWQNGEPDMIFTMPRFHTVPAKGDLETAHFVFPLKLKEARYLRGIEVLPGNRKVVLQANALFDRSGRARELGGEAGWYVRYGGAGFFPAGMIAGYVPGRSVKMFDEGAAMTLTPDMDLVLQVRYRPRGEQEMDVTRVGLYFAKEAPQRSVSAVYLGRENLRIAPGAFEEVIRDRVTLAAPMEVQEVRPRLLRFGQAMRAWAEPPDGKRIGLLEIQDWDYTWQDTCTFSQPISLPKGTVIHSEWTISNPTAVEIRSGETAKDEAPALWLGGVVASPADHAELTRANLKHYTDQSKAARRAR
jgi:hypothetical protein